MDDIYSLNCIFENLHSHIIHKFLKPSRLVFFAHFYVLSFSLV